MNTVLSSDPEIRELLQSARTIAVVGLSARTTRPSYGVARYLAEAGYEIIPVNPHADNWEGIPAFPDLSSIDRKVDLVDVFRRPDFLPATVEDAIQAGVGAVWTQLGVDNPQATEMCVNAGIPIVINRCTAIEHRRLGVSLESAL